MIHEKSREAYRIIKENGLLKKMNWEIYDYLFRHGPHTTRELTVALGIRDNGTTSGRITHLKDLGVVTEYQYKICETTGMEVSLWGVTAVVPAKKEKLKKVRCVHCDGKGYLAG